MDIYYYKAIAYGGACRSIELPDFGRGDEFHVRVRGGREVVREN
jgi:hypothetical protein